MIAERGRPEFDSRRLHFRQLHFCRTARNHTQSGGAIARPPHQISHFDHHEPPERPARCIFAGLSRNHTQSNAIDRLFRRNQAAQSHGRRTRYRMDSWIHQLPPPPPPVNLVLTHSNPPSPCMPARWRKCRKLLYFCVFVLTPCSTQPSRQMRQEMTFRMLSSRLSRVM
jgi:hypothetical protein